MSTPLPEPDPVSRTGRRRRAGAGRGRLVVVVVVIVALAWTAAAAFQLLEARRHAQAGLDQLRAAQRGVGATELIRGEALPDMEQAQESFRAADDSAGSVLVTPFEYLPFVGRQVRSVRSLADGAAAVVDVGVTTMRTSTRQLDVTTASGPERLALVNRLGGIGAEAADRLDEIDPGSGDALVGPLDRAHREFTRELRRARRGMRDVRDASRGVASMAEGSRYLLLAANQSEMRAGSGMLLSAGILTVEQGRFRLAEMVSVTDFNPFPGSVPLSGDYGKVWGWLQPTDEWRYLAMSPQFATTGRLAAAMWKARTGEEVDGVLAMDAIALEGLVKVSGPVDVEGTRIDETNVVRTVLLDQYLDDPAPPFAPMRNDARRERNGVIARAIVDRLDQVGWDIADLVEDLRTAARGRHLLFWSDDPVQQTGWRAAGVSGVLPRDSLMISLANRSGNKLDQFVALAATISHAPVRAGSQVTVTIEAANLTPTSGLSRYVEGPFDETFQVGEYRGILALTVPLVARDISLDGVTKIVAAGRDETTRVIGGDIGLLRGASGTYTLRFTVPRGYERLEVVPSARFPAIGYRAGSDRWVDDGPRSLRW